jgi:hypothetical protein
MTTTNDNRFLTTSEASVQTLQVEVKVVHIGGGSPAIRRRKPSLPR